MRIPLLAVALAFSVAGCANAPPSESSIGAQLELPDGGFDTADEAPMFGDPGDFELAATDELGPADSQAPEVIASHIGSGSGDSDACVGGRMRGRWHPLNDHEGRFRGIVLDREHHKIGHVRGIFGRRHDGKRVLFGKFIDDQGHFIGLIHGTYGDGKLHGKWKQAGDEDHGRIGGRYRGPEDGKPGRFVMRWAQTQCATEVEP